MMTRKPLRKIEPIPQRTKTDHDERDNRPSVSSSGLLKRALLAQRSKLRESEDNGSGGDSDSDSDSESDIGSDSDEGGL